MNILVLNGSPKGDNSVTLQTVLYLAKHFPSDSFEVLCVGQHIKKLEHDRHDVCAKIKAADMLLFSYPVYTFLVPYQLHRFIELLKTDCLCLEGKFAAQISTSKHFYDVTAHRFIAENCADLGLSYLGGLSADMDDLLTEKGRMQAISFWDYMRFCAENHIVQPTYKTLAPPRTPYRACVSPTAKSNAYIAVIVIDSATKCANLTAMCADFEAAFPYRVKVVELAKFPFKGGCLGCFHCASSGKCIYTDGFDSFLREQIQTADAIVYAFPVQDHSMGSTFKLYDDRQFCNGHRTVTMGTPTGYLISGDYKYEANLQTVIEGRCEVGGNFLAGVATDEADTDSAGAIVNLAKSLAFALEHKTALPQNFYGVGGAKIFRDLIYVMRGLMREDHRFYKAHGFYDFPQKKQGTVFKMKAVGALLSIPSMQRKMGGRMNDEILKPYKKVIAQK